MANEQNKFSQNPSSAGSAAGTAREQKLQQDTPSTGLGAIQQVRDTEHDGNESLMNQAKNTAGKAYDGAAAKANTMLEEQKSSLSAGLSTVANSVRKVGEDLKGAEAPGIAKYAVEYSDAAAQKIEQAANYFERKGVKDMYRDVEQFARANPAIFIGGAFAAGLLAARFLKSSNPEQLTKAAGQNFGSVSSFNEGFNNRKTKPSANQPSF